MSTPKPRKKSTKSSPPPPRAAGKPALDRGPAERAAAFVADRAAREAVPDTQLRGRPRAERVAAIVSTVWQLLALAGSPALAARLARLASIGELPPDLLSSLRTSLLAFEHAAARVTEAEAASVAPASAEAAAPLARAVMERLLAACRFYWDDEEEVRTALDGMKVRAAPNQIARHLGTLERIVRARLAGLGTQTGKLKLEDLDSARDLRHQLRPSLDPSLDLDVLEQDMERAYARMNRLYTELVDALAWLERKNPQRAAWPALRRAGARPPTPKAGAKAKGKAGAGAKGKAGVTGAADSKAAAKDASGAGATTAAGSATAAAPVPAEAGPPGSGAPAGTTAATPAEAETPAAAADA